MYRNRFASLFSQAVPFAFAASIAIAPAAYAQDLHAKAELNTPAAAGIATTSAESYAEGLFLRSIGDERGAFQAFLKAAEGGHARAQRRLGEIYDNRNSVAGRDLLESIRWYQKARAQGEQIALPLRRSFGVAGPAL